MSSTASQEAQQEQDSSDGNEKVAHVDKLEDTGGQRAKYLQEGATVNADPDPNAQQYPSTNLEEKREKLVFLSPSTRNKQRSILSTL